MFVFKRILPRCLLLPLLAVFALPVFGDPLTWSLGPETYHEIDAADLDKLTGDALRAGVPIPLVAKSTDMLWNESNPEEIPDGIIARQYLYALILAQERIQQLRATGEQGAPSDDDIRASALAAVKALDCVVTPQDAPEAAREYIAPLTPGQERQMRDFMAELDEFAQAMEARLDSMSLSDPPREEVEPAALPEKPDIMSEARASYENLSAAGKREVQQALRKETLSGFSCRGDGCSSRRCREDVVFETREELVEGTPLQLKYSVVAVPSCACGG